MSDESSSLSFEVSPDEAGSRLDAYLADEIDGWSRGRLQRLIDDGDVLVNDRKVKPSYKIRAADVIEVELTELPATTFEPEDIPLDIVFEDEYLAVINKRAGMVVHPGAGVQSGTLANAIAYHYANWPPAHTDGSDRVGIVHRLDKDTSGLIVVAKDEQTAEELSRQFHDREVEKSYVALVHGSIEQNSGTIDAAIARNKHNRLRMKVAPSGRSALSLWKVKQRFEKFTLLDIEIKTGRTHQIRVHMAYINHPVVGDEIYNEGRDNTVNDINVRNAIRSMGRFFLHAEHLAFTHPKTKDRLEFTQPLPTELSGFLLIL
ncbi:MAG: RluA family pseudouridine synthase [Pyrinomonadaceae bacterium]